MNLEIFDDGDGELFIDSRLVAMRLEIEHESFLKTIRKRQVLMERRFGGLRFEVGVPDKPTGNPPIYALLTEDQALFSVTFSRNTDAALELKADIIEAFSILRRQIRRQKEIKATHGIYLLDDPVAWKSRGRVFTEDFYREIYRLKDWKYTAGKTTHPVCVSQITINVIYRRLQPGIWEMLVEKNPRINGKRKFCCHQFLTENFGNPHLRQHLDRVVFLMRGCRSWRQFEYDLNRFIPITNDVQLDILFDLFRDNPDGYEQWRKDVA
ncbi:MAG: P63C domain-containing protein [Microcoleus sp.]